MLEEQAHKIRKDISKKRSVENTEPREGLEQVQQEKTEKQETPVEPVSGEQPNAQEEIDKKNAAAAEKEHSGHRHFIPLQDYRTMSLENLVGELQRLVRNENIPAIKKHVEAIKEGFNKKFSKLLDEKRQEFVDKGGSETDFKFNSVSKRQFDEVFNEYREKRNQYYKNLETTLNANLENRLAIIEELKGLVTVEEDINTTYKNFKELQQRWKNAGPVPRHNYHDVWRTYHHHMEIFYDFLHLNRELRDLDFKHNLDEKLKLIERAEALAEVADIGKAFRELQTLHKIWKEDIGPVGKEHRDEIWERFSAATKIMHERRQDFMQNREVILAKNLEEKEAIISEIREISKNISKTHKGLQQQIRSLESLRDRFFKVGQVPRKASDQNWAEFKDAVREFNRMKNAFYKNLKKDQLVNLDKKKELLRLAESLKDSEDWETTTPEMKRIQQEWKQIGHVPRKYSEKVWQAFKKACNHYFDRLHARKNKSQEDELKNFEKKKAFIEEVSGFELSGKKESDLAEIKGFIEKWKTLGRVPHDKRKISQKFNKVMDGLLKKTGVSREEAELLKYGNKIQQLASHDDGRALLNERTFIRRKITEGKSELTQLENNMQFFSDASENNPLVKEVRQKIDKQQENLAMWKAKLKKLNIVENQIRRGAEEEAVSQSSEEE